LSVVEGIFVFSEQSKLEPDFSGVPCLNLSNRQAFLKQQFRNQWHTHLTAAAVPISVKNGAASAALSPFPV